MITKGSLVRFVSDRSMEWAPKVYLVISNSYWTPSRKALHMSPGIRIIVDGEAHSVNLNELEEVL